jgi:uncharacterized protein YuzB (UPF0349 family)
MQVKLCKKSLARLGGGRAALLEALEEREHTVLLQECLNRCQACDLGVLIALADGVALSAKAPEKLLADLDELAADAG